MAHYYIGLQAFWPTANNALFFEAPTDIAMLVYVFVNFTSSPLRSVRFQRVNKLK